MVATGSRGRMAGSVAGALMALAASAGAASAQGAPSAQPPERMGFTAKPDVFAPKLVQQEDAPLAALTPVTDAILKDPPAADWLMWRRT